MLFGACYMRVQDDNVTSDQQKLPASAKVAQNQFTVKLATSNIVRRKAFGVHWGAYVSLRVCGLGVRCQHPWRHGIAKDRWRCWGCWGWCWCVHACMWCVRARARVRLQLGRVGGWGGVLLGCQRARRMMPHSVDTFSMAGAAQRVLPCYQYRGCLFVSAMLETC